MLPRAISTSLSTSLSASLSTSLSVVWSATPIWLACYDNIIAPLPQHHCPATATSLFCYGNIILLLFNALSWLFSVLVVKLIEPIKVKKRVSIVRLCEIFSVYCADYVKFWVFIVQIMWNFWYLWCGLCEKQGRLCGGLCEKCYLCTYNKWIGIWINCSKER